MDYTHYALESSIQDLHILQEYEIADMMYEVAFLESCYETGIIGVLEVTKDNIFYDLVEALKAFFEKMKSIFRAKCRQKYEKYFDEASIKNLRANVDKLKAEANKLHPQKVVPMWDVSLDSLVNETTNVVAGACRNVKSNKVKDYNCYKPMVGDTKYVSEKNSDMSLILKNYYRFGEGTTETKQITITGSDLAGKIETMIDFMASFVSKYEAMPGKMSDKINNSLKDVESVNESFGPDYYLSTEQRYVAESLLPIMVNYSDVVIEAKKNKSNTPSAGEVTRSVGNDGKFTDDAKNKAKSDNVSASKPEAVDKSKPLKDESKEDNKDTPSGDNTTDDKKDDVKLSTKAYVDELINFTKYCVTALQTSIDERFTLYQTLLFQCGAKEYCKDASPEDIKRAEQKTNQETEQAVKKEKGVLAQLSQKRNEHRAKRQAKRDAKAKEKNEKYLKKYGKAPDPNKDPEGYRKWLSNPKDKRVDVL